MVTMTTSSGPRAFCRGELGGDGAGDGEVRPDRDTHREPEHDQLPRFGGEELQHRQEDERGDVGQVHLLPPDPVRDVPEHEPAHEHADQRGGPDEPGAHGAQPERRYVDAAAALRLGPIRHGPDGAVFSISELRTHQLLAETHPRSRDRLRAATLDRLRHSTDWPVLRRTLIAWAESGFNLVRAADELHVHRNSCSTGSTRSVPGPAAPAASPATG
jgi:hypothetical protein